MLKCSTASTIARSFLVTDQCLLIPRACRSSLRTTSKTMVQSDVNLHHDRCSIIGLIIARLQALSRPKPAQPNLRVNSKASYRHHYFLQHDFQAMYIYHPISLLHIKELHAVALQLKGYLCRRKRRAYLQNNRRRGSAIHTWQQTLPSCSFNKYGDDEMCYLADH